MSQGLPSLSIVSKLEDHAWRYPEDSPDAREGLPAVMATRSREDPRLTRVSNICLALPHATRQDLESHASFLIRKKPFAYFLNNHHGDGIVSIACKALPGDNSALVAAQPDRFYLPAYIGPRGWVALRLDVGEADWQEVSELITGSYCLVAPKRLAASVAS